nr:unnamed protein product [Digitaria exilis]
MHPTVEHAMSFSKLRTLGARHGIADKIRQLKARVDDVSKRHGRYIYGGATSAAGVPDATAAVAIDPRLPALSKTAGNLLVGIDGPREDIIKLLLMTDDGEIGKKKKLKVVSIVGFGGLGKTTLACEVRQELRGQFDCQVIVSVSQSPDIIKILTKILSEVKGPQHHMRDISDLQDLIEEIKTCLLHRSQADKLKEDWEYVHKSMGSNVGTDRRLEVMRHILNLSYKNLPPHLKACFLYLGAYPEDSVIWRDDLVRQWVAEGFVGGTHLEANDVAANYFNQLVNRSMIQPVVTGYDGEIVSCRVHDMMVDLIIRPKCEEENFLTAIEYSNEVKIKGSIHNVRRLFQYSDSTSFFDATPLRKLAIDLSKLRSVSTCGSCTYIPPLSEFKFIRVLILRFVRTQKKAPTVDLTAICKLFQLRYLKISSSLRLRLPTQIRGLLHLETLEIISAVEQEVPSDVFQLPRLSFLSILPHMASLPAGVGAARCLRSLASFALQEETLDLIAGLRHLSKLKELHIHLPVDERFEETAEARVDGLCSSLPKHGGCKLYINAWSPKAWFDGVPAWVSCLQRLYSLEFGVEEVSRDGVAILAGLPALVRLDLWIRGTPKESIVVAGVGFPALKHLIVTCRALCLTFEPGAMPRLQNLKLEFDADGEQGGCRNALAGVEHLPGLREIHARIGVLRGATGIAVGAVMSVLDGRSAAGAGVSVLEDAIGLHPNKPRVDIAFTEGSYGGS